MKIVDLAKARRAEFDALKTKAADADILVAEPEKVRDKLPKEAKDAIANTLRKRVIIDD